MCHTAGTCAVPPLLLLLLLECPYVTAGCQLGVARGGGVKGEWRTMEWVAAGEANVQQHHTLVHRDVHLGGGGSKGVACDVKALAAAGLMVAAAVGRPALGRAHMLRHGPA
jgi:hypothetical protein